MVTISSLTLEESCCCRKSLLSNDGISSRLILTACPSSLPLPLSKVLSSVNAVDLLV